jgi:hypothetical protein
MAALHLLWSFEVVGFLRVVVLGQVQALEVVARPEAGVEGRRRTRIGGSSRAVDMRRLRWNQSITQGSPPLHERESQSKGFKYLCRFCLNQKMAPKIS